MESKYSKITILNHVDFLRLYELEYQKLPDGPKFCHHLFAHSFDEAYRLSLSLSFLLTSMTSMITTFVFLIR